MAYFHKSPWIMHYDASSCNGCDIEVLACLTPLYDVERFGVINTGNPKHADILLITGSVNEQTREVVENIYHQMPEPKVVVATGICATSGGVFAECYNIQGGVDKVIPVDVYVTGCAAKPEAIIDGVVKALGILERKYEAMQALAGGVDQMIIAPAAAEDLPEILALQKIAFKSEAEIYNDFSMAPLRQSMTDIQTDFQKMVFFKAVINGKIVGSARGWLDKESGTGHVGRLVVHPYFHGRGLGHKMLLAVETALAASQRFEVFTGHKSKRNIQFFERCGYKPFRQEKVGPGTQRERLYMEKINHA